MTTELLTGKLTRLTAEDHETIAATSARWRLDTELARLLDSDPPRPWSEKKIQEWVDKYLEKEDPNDFSFQVRDLKDDKVLGFVALFDLQWHHGDAWIAIALGEREYWGQGYGSDAMNVMLRYAFQEMNLRRITLLVFEYNPRARRAYEKLGFVEEGRLRGMMQREGQRWDWIVMGILRAEWEALNK